MLDQLSEGDVYSLAYIFAVLVVMIVTFFIWLWLQARALRKYRWAVMSWFINWGYTPTVANALMDRYAEDVRNAMRLRLSTLYIAREIAMRHEEAMRDKGKCNGNPPYKP